MDNAIAVAGPSSQETEPQRKNLYLITEEMLQERLEHENRGRFITQLACAVAASLAALSFGAVLGWSSSAPSNLISQVKEYNISEESSSWVASLMPLGCSAGIMPWSYGIKNLGPKHIMILQTPFYILTLLVMTTAKRFQSFIAGRFFSGFLSIAYVMGGERLLSDSVHMGHLRIMIVCFRASVTVGLFLSYLSSHYLSRIYLTTMCISIPIINAALLSILPESPVFLYDRSERKAEMALCWYRGRSNIYMAMHSLRKDSEIRKVGLESYKYMLYSKVVMKALLIIVGLNFFRVFSGYYAFIFYNLLLWREFSNMFNSSSDATIFGLCLCISNIIGNLVHYHSTYGVRKPLLTSCTSLSIALTVITCYSFLYEQHIILNYSDYLNWIPLLAANAFLIGYEMGLSTYSDIILYDYLPYQVHVRAKTISEVLYWFQVFLLVKYFITVRSLTYPYVNFGIMTVISYISIFYCYYFIIETKGKNLIEIQIEIGGNPIGNRGAYRYRMGHGHMLYT